VRQMGHVVFRRTNQDTRHSEWNSWPQACSLRIASGSVGGCIVDVLVGRSVVVLGAVAVDGRMAASSVADCDVRRAGFGGEGAYKAERHIAHSRSWKDEVSTCAGAIG